MVNTYIITTGDITVPIGPDGDMVSSPSKGRGPELQPCGVPVTEPVGDINMGAPPNTPRPLLTDATRDLREGVPTVVVGDNKTIGGSYAIL